jgi:hypothetical protein
MTKAVVSGTYIDQLSEYNTANQKIVRGGYVGAYSITPSITTKTIDNSQIGPELQKQIDAGNLPQPSFDSKGNSNTIFIIHFAPGISITLKQGGQTATSCVEFCGFHYGFSLKSNNKSVRYAVVPDMGKGTGCAVGCGVGGEAVSLGDTISHETAEAITDPDIWKLDPAWYDVNTQGCGEVGDICAPGSGPDPTAGDGTLDGVRVQKEWSQKNQTCQLSDPNVAPQAGCSSDADCAAPLPHCDPTSKSCIGCNSNTDCTNPRPVCDSTVKACGPCAQNSDCAAPTAICVTNAVDNGPALGACVGCLQNSDCTSDKPVCTSNACTGCSSDNDCADPANPKCDTGSGKCGAPVPDAGTGGSGGGNNNNGGGTGSSGGCAVSDGPTSGGALGFGGLLFGIAAFSRARARRRAAR